MFDHKRNLKFEALWKASPPGQGSLEYRLFLSFAKDYLAWRGVLRPVVVEIGVRRGHQRIFYKELLNAEYIGIDINANYANGDDYILGDSRKAETFRALATRLKGRRIDLLFIDGNHTYEGCKGDWELYSPITSSIVAIHDILPRGLGVRQFWMELCASKYQVVEFKCPHDSRAARMVTSPERENRNKDDGLGVVLL